MHENPKHHLRRQSIIVNDSINVTIAKYTTLNIVDQPAGTDDENNPAILIDIITNSTIIHATILHDLDHLSLKYVWISMIVCMCVCFVAIIASELHLCMGIIKTVDNFCYNNSF